MADNRQIRNKIRGENGSSFSYGMEDELAAAYDQKRLDELKRDGVIAGDWQSTRTAMTVTGDVSDGMAGKLQQQSGGAAKDATGEANEFQPLSVEETIERMKKMDFSEQVTRSMTFHGDALKEAIEKSRTESSKKPGGKSEEEPQNEDGDFPEGFPAYAKVALKKLGKTYADIEKLDREKLIDLDGIADKSADEILEFVKGQAVSGGGAAEGK